MEDPLSLEKLERSQVSNMKIKERSQDLGWEMRSLVRLNESSDELDIIQATTLGNLLRRAEDQRAGFWVTSLGK